jgi:plastocyanin
MKTISTFKNRVSPRLLFLSTLVLLLSTSLFGAVKHSVSVTNYKFTPSDLQISVGDTVVWKNTQGSHNVNGTKTTFPSNPESFGNSVGSGWTFSYVFKTAGKYDYQCNPHASGGMVGKIEVKEGVVDDGKYDLTVNFTGMTPHVGENIYLSLTDKNSGFEIERKKQIASVSFSVVFSGIEKDHSYNVDFYADHNKNGGYDAPPTDHAWRMELNNVTGNSTLNFAHNTNFTNINWNNKLTVHFMGMTPHVGENLHLAVIDKNSGVELQRVIVIAAVDFMIDVFGIENGKSYNVDFFADHNKNGSYDDPSADHAWRLELNDVKGDTTLMFQHNTNFTKIDWKNKLTVHFMGMTPHVGENLHLAVIDKNSGVELQRVSVIAAVDFMIDVFGIENGKSYNVDFFADHNKNGSYDVPPTDHSWRLELNDVKGDTTLMFQHNTSFTNINWIATAVSELNNSLLKMYPNPATDRVFIEMDKISAAEIQVSVYDITGNLRYETLKPFTNRIELDIQSLSNGIYLIDLKTNSKHQIFKLIKY